MPQIPRRAEFVVIGAGLLGLSAARALRRRAHDVLVLERETVGHARGGSKGASRIFRLGYADARYVRMAMDARPLWEELEAEAACRLMQPTGQLTFGRGLSALQRAMKDAGAPVRAMPVAEAPRPANIAIKRPRDRSFCCNRRTSCSIGRVLISSIVLPPRGPPPGTGAGSPGHARSDQDPVFRSAPRFAVGTGFIVPHHG